ncbi:MAG: urease accessory protein UreD [Zoogloeaceae bacterium]|nr:urease accessory protein UreD [Zoogloeaceae bacterium]
MNAPLDSCVITPAGSAAGPWRARLQLGFERRGERTVLAERSHIGPLRLQKALYPEGERICHGIVLHPPAGIAGGDELSIDVTVGAGAHALLTTPGAGKWYRSAGAEGRLRQCIEIAPGALCEWVPQESIVFDCALGRLETRVELQGDAAFVGMEMVRFGRSASGERFTAGDFRSAIRISRDGRPVWLERSRIDGGGRLLEAGVGLAGWPVSGTLIVATPVVEDEVLEAWRGVAPIEGDGAVTRLPGVLLARFRGSSCEAGREWFVKLWSAIRPRVAGVPVTVPRIWNT